MSERILKALMQLFAVVADSDSHGNKSRTIVELFLRQQLSQELVIDYLSLYDTYREQHSKGLHKKEGRKKRNSLSSVKILKICTQINSELAQRQKLIVLIRILEYINSDLEITKQEHEFAITVSETFNIPHDEFNTCVKFITRNVDNLPEGHNLLLINSRKSLGDRVNKHIIVDNLDGNVMVMHFESVNMFAFRSFTPSELYLNGQIINPKSTYVLTQGSSIRNPKINPIYYSDILKAFLVDESKPKIAFCAHKIEYKFPNGGIGLRELSFTEDSGKMIAIMGGSGAGKSTLLNILNGNHKPVSGSVSINGIDIYKDTKKIEGVIGYVSQDDLLIEELTVFQNLYYNAHLCFRDKTDFELKKLVLDLLNSLGLEETSNLKVGSPMDKTISGGQRKRLNIGLELIREPAVLFADEPTSGLSSRDSENIMDLLKELAHKGKLVFVVIHQPSSDIFKMFDSLLILDVGGYPIYYGNPVDSVVYFKKMVNHVNANESECPRCGNVNPEQIFNTIDSKVLDEYGNLTDNRKISPKEWNDFYKNNLLKNNDVPEEELPIPESTSRIPSKFRQFKVFIKRDVLSKLTNSQYLLINFLEAPVLGFILAFFVKFFDTDVKNQLGYTYQDNENIPVYLFMAVVVSLFIGMTVSAEEIIRDQKIRKRETFLNLSNASYLNSKILIMFIISAVQTLTFVLIGNTILEIKGMYLAYWFVLFSTACFANMVGLNISSTFNSAVTIYILIPFLLIPQLLFSGIIVKFDKLNPVSTSQEVVPVIGDVMASRWAFEALAVYQFKNNDYDKHFYNEKKKMSIASFKKNFWVPKLKAKLSQIKSSIKKGETDLEKVTKNLKLIILELNKVQQSLSIPSLEALNMTSITSSSIDLVTISKLEEIVTEINRHYSKNYNNASHAKDALINEFKKTFEEKEAFKLLKRNYENLALTELVTNKKDIQFIMEKDNKLIQRSDPIYLEATGFRSHFYAPNKKIFGAKISTFWANTIVLWLMSFALIVTLYFDFFRKIIEFSGKILGRK